MGILVHIFLLFYLHKKQLFLLSHLDRECSQNMMTHIISDFSQHIEVNEWDTTIHTVHWLCLHNMVLSKNQHRFEESDVHIIRKYMQEYISLQLIIHRNQVILDIYPHRCLWNYQRRILQDILLHIFLFIYLPILSQDIRLHIGLCHFGHMFHWGILKHILVIFTRQNSLQDISSRIHYEYHLCMQNSKLNIFVHIYE